MRHHYSICMLLDGGLEREPFQLGELGSCSVHHREIQVRVDSSIPVPGEMLNYGHNAFARYAVHFGNPQLAHYAG
ncbi:hypothetical protein D3C73_772780 [compost metagenome]